MCVILPYRGDFTVQFDHETPPTNVFQLLKQACFKMGKVSLKIWQNETSAAKPLQQHLNQRFVYARFMWGEYTRESLCCMCVTTVIRVWI